MSHAQTKDLIAAYYDAFNRGDTEAMEAMLHDDFEHHVNEGGIRRGKQGFAEFNRHMSETYRCLLYTSPSPRDLSTSRMPSSA